MPDVKIETQATAPIEPYGYARLLETAKRGKAVHGPVPLTFEQLGQDHGYALYSAKLAGTGEDMTLSFPQNGGSADVYLDGRFAGSVMRDRNDSVEIKTKKGALHDIDVLFENTGRINYGLRLFEETGPGRVQATTGRHSFQLFGWDCLSLPFKTLELEPGEFKPTDGPVIIAGRFEAEPGVDTFLDMRGFGEGFVFVNGFNLGRFRGCGPQYTLYVPGELLKKDNEIRIFDRHGIKRKKAIRTRKTQLLK